MLFNNRNKSEFYVNDCTCDVCQRSVVKVYVFENQFFYNRGQVVSQCYKKFQRRLKLEMLSV